MMWWHVNEMVITFGFYEHRRRNDTYAWKQILRELQWRRMVCSVAAEVVSRRAVLEAKKLVVNYGLDDEIYDAGICPN